MTAKELCTLIVKHEEFVSKVEYQAPPSPGFVTLTLHIPKPFLDVTAEDVIRHGNVVRQRVAEWLYQEVLDVGTVLRIFVFTDGAP